MNFKDIVLSVMSQTQEDKYYMAYSYEAPKAVTFIAAGWLQSVGRGKWELVFSWYTVSSG